MQNSAHSFVIQGNLSLEEQIAYCKKIIFKYRDEVQLLRKDKQKCEHDHTDLEEQIKEWEKQYGILQEKVRGVEKENGKLKKEIEKLTKTNERYRVALFDHGNFKAPIKKRGNEKEDSMDTLIPITIVTVTINPFLASEYLPKHAVGVAIL